MLRRIISKVINQPSHSTVSTTSILTQAKYLHSKAGAFEPSATSSSSKLAVYNFSAISDRFFSTPTQAKRSFSKLPSGTTPFQTSPYVSGPVLTPSFLQRNKVAIETSKAELKKILDFKLPQAEDLSLFVDCLFDFEKSRKLIQKIDFQTKKILAAIKPGLFDEYEKIVLDNKEATSHEFLKNKFLPTLRTVFQELAKHYGFDPKLVETNDGVLLDDDYMDFITQGKLILDLGEDGHGPFPHIIAAFMMKELELGGQLSSAYSLYQSLAHRGLLYNPDRMNFEYHFRPLLDFPNTYPLTSTVFCNPSSLANHLLFNCTTLKQFATVCKKHSTLIAQLSRADWEKLENKNHLVMGKVIQF